MKCVQCGRELILYRRDVVVTQYDTDEDGDQTDWIEDDYQEEREKWYKCGCEVCPYVPNRTLNAPGIVAELQDAGA